MNMQHERECSGRSGRPHGLDRRVLRCGGVEDALDEDHVLDEEG
jgi:hypothetical protein